MANLNANFTKFMGDDFSLIFEVDGVGNIESGYSAIWAMSLENPDNVNPSSTITKLIEKDSSDPSEINFSNNNVIVNIEKSDTETMVSGSYYHDCQLINTSTSTGGIIASGTFTLRTPLNKR